MPETHNNAPKPCPFCAFAAPTLTKDGSVWFYRCPRCGVRTRNYAEADDARQTWNRRADVALPWVSVAERLPEPEQLCLWWHPKAPPFVAHVGGISAYGYTHWLSLSPEFFPAATTGEKD